MSDANLFQGYMLDKVWDGDRATYDRWGNANLCAMRKFFARKVAPSSRDGEQGYIYTFPDGSRLFIARHGGMTQSCGPINPNNVQAGRDRAKRRLSHIVMSP